MGCSQNKQKKGKREEYINKHSHRDIRAPTRHGLYLRRGKGIVVQKGRSNRRANIRGFKNKGNPAGGNNGAGSTMQY